MAIAPKFKWFTFPETSSEAKLDQAIMAGDLGGIRDALESGANPNGGEWMEPIHKAAIFG